MTQLYSDSELLDMMRKAARELGRTPGYKSFRDRGWPGQTVIQRFGTWSEACVRAGLTPNPRVGGGERRYDDAAVLAAYARITEAVGKQPSLREWDRWVADGEPSSVAMRKRYGSWTAFIEAMGGEPKPYQRLTPGLELRSSPTRGVRAKNEVLT